MKAEFQLIVTSSIRESASVPYTHWDVQLTLKDGDPKDAVLMNGPSLQSLLLYMMGGISQRLEKRAILEVYPVPEYVPPEIP